MAKVKKRIGEIDFYLLSTVLILVAIGIVMVWSASSYVALHKNNNANYYLIKQLINVSIGLIGMIFAINVDYQKYKKLTIPIAIITFILLVVVLFSKPINGATRWINLGFTTIQPSEIAKYAVVLILAFSLEKAGEKIKKFTVLIFHLLIGGGFAFMVLLEKNMSIFSVMVIVTFIVVFIDGAKFIHLFGLGISAFVGGIYLIFSADYRVKRLMSFTDPWVDPLGDGYQLIQSFYALGTGGLMGVGLGQSRQKAFYIPEPHNDFIFSIIGEELGFIGCITIILLFCFFIIRGIGIAFKAKDTYGTLIAVGFTSIIAIQAIINIAVVSGSMPVTGVPLPFISYGGSAIAINLFAMGVLLNISKQNSK
ncbi:putative lipid II flippase FtsW [Oceanirhabdus sp. W0125-5]|uniref:putative lipid II flippase FtsW n=1 Tax=Oceanirhabdus sp. W0125-5 TaxID=2999116 RepID=UPI0022F2A8A1|nr:putative lipid II flippase FtsW [Oceanirhabdus sp. W0125-5]WBW95352.1 putative lipid II flippase FtsW [Oceanirhabdus sp. W0125-5]